jgi:hypothetical protein
MASSSTQMSTLNLLEIVVTKDRLGKGSSWQNFFKDVTIGQLLKVIGSQLMEQIRSPNELFGQL